MVLATSNTAGPYKGAGLLLFASPSSIHLPLDRDRETVNAFLKCTGGGAMKKKYLIIILSIALTLPAIVGFGYQLPPLNFGLTNVLDQPPGPGLYLFEYIQAFEASDFTDGNGNKIFPGEKLDTLLAFNQLIWVSKYPLLGGFLGFDLIEPVVTINTNGAFLTANPNNFGDPVVGPFIQWFNKKLFGLPYLHRFELDITLPVGAYNKNFTLNPGSNIWTIEPYYAFTLFFTPNFPPAGVFTTPTMVKTTIRTSNPGRRSISIILLSMRW